MDDHYLVEIEYFAKEKRIVKALNKEQAEILTREKWEGERNEPISTMLIKKHR